MVARFGSFTLDSDQRRIVGAEGEAHVTPKAFDLLRLLIRHAPRVVSKTEIHAALWPDTFVSDAALIVLIKEIRRALSDRDASAPIVRTVHRVGYAFRAALRVDPVDVDEESDRGGVEHRVERLMPTGAALGADTVVTICLEQSGEGTHYAKILLGRDGARLMRD